MAQSGYNATNSLIFDHLARRDIIDGLKEYPKEAIQCHEEFIRGVRRKMKAAIEIVYGQSVQKRLLQTISLEPFPLWGKYEGIPLFLEWDCMDSGRLIRFITFAYHPQSFLFVWGPRKYGHRQDRIMEVVELLAKFDTKKDHFQRLQHLPKAVHTECVYKLKTKIYTNPTDKIPQVLVTDRIIPLVQPQAPKDSADEEASSKMKALSIRNIIKRRLR